MTLLLDREHHRNVLLIVSLIFLLPTVIVNGPKAAAENPTPILRGQHLLRSNSVQQREFAALSSALAEEGIIRLQLVAAPQQPENAQRLIQFVNAGKIDFAVVPITAFVQIAPQSRVFEIPFLFRDPRHFAKIQPYFYSHTMLEELRSHGVEGIGTLPGEPLVLASRRPVLEPTDLREQRTATYSASNIGEASAVHHFKSKLGAIPKALQRNRVMSELKGGQIDVLEIELTELARFSPQKLSVLLTNHLYTTYIVIVNPARWSILPSNTRDRFMRQLELANDHLHNELVYAVRNASLELKQAAGLSLIPLPENQRKAWRDALRTDRLEAKAGIALVHSVEQEAAYELAMVEGNGHRKPSITWNAWFEHGSETTPKDVPVLEINDVYRFNLDLARYQYSEGLSAGLGTTIEKLLHGKGERILLLQPVLLGNQLEAAPGKALKPRELTVRLDRAGPGPEDESFLDQFEHGKITTRALSREVNLGGFASWDLKATEAGCGGIAITVWDQGRSVPLDHIVLKVPVHHQGQGPASCGHDSTARAMTAGLQSMLEAPLPQVGGRTPDAALHIFEIQEDTGLKSHAVLLHRQRLLASLADPNATDSGVYSWELASVLSSYVSDPAQMPRLIQDAHYSISQKPPGKYPYEEVARELHQKIFSGNSHYDREQAKLGRAALHDVINSTPDPVVVVRVVSQHGQSLFIPFGLIAASATQPLVSKRFTVFQPLPTSRPVSSACIGPWSIARPKILQGIGGEERILLATAPSTIDPKKFRILPDHASLSTFLLGSVTSPTDHGEGLILLAHHDQGYLRYSDTDRPPSRIGQEFIEHKFRPGSVAMLAACSTTGKADETRAIADRLINQGVDTLIISPFAVDATFGTRFALEFEKVVLAESAKSTEASIGTLFDRAASEVIAAYDNQALRRDMALEFMLVGNPDLRLCK